jgi:hypothetical protein
MKPIRGDGRERLDRQRRELVLEYIHGQLSNIACTLLRLGKLYAAHHVEDAMKDIEEDKR